MSAHNILPHSSDAELVELGMQPETLMIVDKCASNNYAIQVCLCQ